MNTNLMRNALTSYLSMSSITDKEREQSIRALEELSAVEERAFNADVWDNEAVVVPMEAWDDLLNQLTYDIMGRRMRRHNGNVRPDFYYADVRKALLGMEAVPNCYLKVGYEILRDLWMTNEAEHSNSYDGTFKKNKIGDKYVAADFSCAELYLIGRCVEWVKGNMEECLGVAFDIEHEPVTDSDKKWLAEVLTECLNKINTIYELDTDITEDQVIFTVEDRNDAETLYGSNK
jgi:hypothetical protein